MRRAASLTNSNALLNDKAAGGVQTYFLNAFESFFFIRVGLARKNRFAIRGSQNDMEFAAFFQPKQRFSIPLTVAKPSMAWSSNSRNRAIGHNRTDTIIASRFRSVDLRGANQLVFVILKHEVETRFGFNLRTFPWSCVPLSLLMDNDTFFKSSNRAVLLNASECPWERSWRSNTVGSREWPGHSGPGDSSESCHWSSKQ